MALQQFHTYFAMCTSRCGLVTTVEDGVLKSMNADPDHPKGCICAKVKAAPDSVYSPDRLQYPMVRPRPKGDSDPGWAMTLWDNALALVSSRLLDINARYWSKAVVFSRATPGGSASTGF